MEGVVVVVVVASGGLARCTSGNEEEVLSYPADSTLRRSLYRESYRQSPTPSQRPHCAGSSLSFSRFLSLSLSVSCVYIKILPPPQQMTVDKKLIQMNAGVRDELENIQTLVEERIKIELHKLAESNPKTVHSVCTCVLHDAQPVFQIMFSCNTCAGALLCVTCANNCHGGRLSLSLSLFCVYVSINNNYLKGHAYDLRGPIIGSCGCSTSHVHCKARSGNTIYVDLYGAQKSGRSTSKLKPFQAPMLEGGNLPHQFPPWSTPSMLFVRGYRGPPPRTTYLSSTPHTHTQRVGGSWKLLYTLLHWPLAPHSQIP